MSVFTNPASGTPEDTARYVDALLGLLADSDPVAILRHTPDAVKELIDRLRKYGFAEAVADIE